MSKPVFSDLFTLSGRRNRKSYFLYWLAVLIVMIIVWVIAILVASDSDSNTALIIAYVISFAVGISYWIVGAQRCRDFGWTGWAILLTLIPFIGWIFPWVMLFVPGTDGPNRYGPDPLRVGP